MVASVPPTADWSPTSWTTKKVSQGPNYQDEEELQAAVDKLSSSSPLVFAGEVRTLHEQLARACSGQGFVLMGGDCAEAFNEFNVDHVRDTFRVLLQMSLVNIAPFSHSSVSTIACSNLLGNFDLRRISPYKCFVL